MPIYTLHADKAVSDQPSSMRGTFSSQNLFFWERFGDHKFEEKAAICGYHTYTVQCGFQYSVGSSTVWVPVQCGFQYSVDSSTVWVPVQCGFQYSVDSSTVWVPVQCGFQ